ncbi:S-layer homology domain-containing protein [Paenibacillus bouchesdurhonensis]|uniref:S-layer homology domain-containing protein n=1 Tax=Paenibacillus bouchesdurhonensis TaxID=1870990 RepID=UPI0018FF4815|nr:S-layer homology domain-containing protein [Paenibacillus bouchesdurhonensis]
MKKLRGLLSLLLASILTIGFSVQIIAAKDVKTKGVENGRAQLVLEFDDIQEAEWAAGYITKMQSKKVLQGFEDGTFRPNQPVTRVEAIVTAVRLMGLESEAKSQSMDTQLHFKDADQLDKRFPWAKGYVIVALEHGLFDAAEDKIIPDKPASRVWVSSLLVKSLGLQDEALRQMTKIPDFNDAKAIPAGAIGYVNVAVSQGIVSGYPDGTFKPNKNVTRAEMAALLDRTNDGLLQNQGAVSISGTVKEIQFTTDAADNFNNQSNGQIKIETWNKELLSYGISSKLPVKHNKKFILADQIAVNNPMRLIVKDGQVVEAELLSTKEVSKDGTSKKEPNQEKKPNQEQKAGAIAEFDFEVELAGKEKIKLEYKNKKGTAQAQVEKESKKDKEKLKGNQAVQYMEELIAKAGLTDSMSGNEAVDKLMAALNIDKGQVKELELEVKFSSGKQMKIEFENDDDHDDDDED